MNNAEIQVGEYCRVDGNIAKLLSINEYENRVTFDAPIEIPLKGVSKTITIYDMLRYTTNHSHNIIDLIEEGDYVNGNLISEVDKTKKEIRVNDYYVTTFRNEHIQTIVTHEQFKNMEYEVGEDD